MIDGSWWERGLIAWRCCWGRGDVREHLDLSHYTRLQGAEMIRHCDFMRRWWVTYDDRVSWLPEDIDGYHGASVRAFTRFQRSRHDYVGWMPVFSIGHVRSREHDVRGFGQRMGGHHFMNLFTLLPSYIELPVASPLSLTRAHNLFFHHLIYLSHRVGDPVVLACYVWIRHEF